jgi:hypothetical protein
MIHKAIMWRRVTVIVVSGMLLAMSVWSPVAGAQSTGLAIMPRKDYTIQRGGVVKDSVRVANLSKTDKLQLHLELVDFKARGNTGIPQFSEDANATREAWSARPFIVLPGTITLEPGQSKNIDYQISIPANQGAGSYYSALRYRSQMSDKKDVRVATSGATLLFINVPGSVKEQMTLHQLGAFVPATEGVDGEFKLFFFGNPPKQIAYTLQNNGNIVESPQGSIVIRNAFGKQTYVIKDANPKDSLALIEQTRRFEVCIKTVEKTVKTPAGEVKEPTCDTPRLSPGRYTIELDVLYGQPNQRSYEVMAMNSFWYLPAWFIAIVTGGLLVAGLAIGFGVRWYLRRKRSQRKAAAHQARREDGGK